MKKLFNWKYFPLYLSIVFIGQVSAASAEALSISAFRKLNPPSGEFTVWGYVVKQYTCPPCPQGLMCKPCMRNNVLFSPYPKIQEDYPDGGNDLIIFTEHPEKLQLGKSYDLTVIVHDDDSEGYRRRSLILKAAAEQARQVTD